MIAIVGMALGRGQPVTMRPADFHTAPFLVLWELTRACDLVCKHCRANAQTAPDSAELDTSECLAQLDHLREAFGPVLVVLTGGDPLKRADLETITAHGAGLGLRMTLTPSATPLLTPTRIASVHAAGMCRLAVSLDGIDAPTHDAFRGVPGTFERTLAALETARSLGLETQVNSSVGKHNLQQLDQLAKLVAWYGAKLWSVFILVATGRADKDMLATALEHERIYQRLADLSAQYPFDLKTTAGQPYYRVQAQRMLRFGVAQRIEDLTPQRMGLRAARGVNDGNGVVFIGHDGVVHPSGFLPIDCGNVRKTPLAEIYRNHPVFTALRNPDRYAGKCGVCEFRQLCGGSRSRSYALTGDYLASDPTCVYQPKVRAG